MAGSVDALYFFMVAVTAFFSILIAAMVVASRSSSGAVRTTRSGIRSHGSLVARADLDDHSARHRDGDVRLGRGVYFKLATVPNDAMEIYVVGKRWMWKAQHVSGQKEINELHVPVGQPVKLILDPEDVIHSFYIPAFRVKMDAVPGRHTVMWFEATTPGKYHLFCAEYCGTEPLGHDRHRPRDGGRPSSRPGSAAAARRGTMAEAGQKLFEELGCITLPHRRQQPRAVRALEGLFGDQRHAGQRRQGQSPTRTTSASRSSRRRRRWCRDSRRSCRPIKGR